MWTRLAYIGALLKDWKPRPQPYACETALPPVCSLWGLLPKSLCCCRPMWQRQRAARVPGVHRRLRVRSGRCRCSPLQHASVHSSVCQTALSAAGMGANGEWFKRSSLPVKHKACGALCPCPCHCIIRVQHELKYMAKVLTLHFCLLDWRDCRLGKCCAALLLSVSWCSGLCSLTFNVLLRRRARTPRRQATTRRQATIVTAVCQSLRTRGPARAWTRPGAHGFPVCAVRPSSTEEK